VAERQESLTGNGVVGENDRVDEYLQTCGRLCFGVNEVPIQEFCCLAEGLEDADRMQMVVFHPRCSTAMIEIQTSAFHRRQRDLAYPEWSCYVA